MKKIIDVGYLRDERLEAYLKEDVNNKLVFHNYTCLEAMKADTYNMKLTFEIVGKYTNQIQALKGIDEIWKVDYNSTDFQETFISEEQTLLFQNFFLRVSGADDSDTEDAKDLERRSRYAAKCIDEITVVGIAMAMIIEMYIKEMDKDFIEYVRTGKEWKKNEYEFVRTNVHEICKKPFKEIYGIQLSEKENILNHYIFRDNLSKFFLALKWVTEHGWKSYPVENMRNDIIDMFYVSFASYFDGVLSNDKKVNSIYEQVIDFIAFYENNSPNN